MDNFLQGLFADRIGGSRFGLDTKIYKFEKIKRAKAAAKAAHPELPLIDMGVGEPDVGASPAVVERLYREAGKPENRFYADNGCAEFKDAAAEYMRKLYGVEVDPLTQVNHTIGSKSALALLPAAFINPGDVTLLTVPGYPVLGTWTAYMGGRTVALPLEKDRGFLPDLDKISAADRRDAKLLYLNYPNNPTGAVATEEFYDRAIAFALENRLLIVSDAAYAPLNYCGRPLSILSRPRAMECAVELHSMSKGFNMTGWRLGWICGNAAAVKAFATVKDNADSGQFLGIQKAAVSALEQCGTITPQTCRKYLRRLSALADTLRSLGFDAAVPGGSFYLYVGIPKAVEGGPVFPDAESFSQWMIAEKLISTVPWDDCGHFVRFSATFSARDLEEEAAVLNEVRLRLADSRFVF